MLFRRYLIYVLVGTLFSSCYRDTNSYLTAKKQDIIGLRSDKQLIPADGKSMSTIEAILKNGSDLKYVQFSTNRGKFLDSSISYSTNAVPQNGELIATAFLVSAIDTSSYVRVRASIAGIDTIINLRFITALPDRIKIESPSSYIKRGLNNEISLSIFLQRDIGVPSIGQKVKLSAHKDNGDPIGTFKSVSLAGSDATGLINATYQLRDTIYTGRITVISEFENTQPSLKDSLYFFIIN